MANLFFDGFERLSNLFLDTHWDANNPEAFVSSSNARPGGSGQAAACWNGGFAQRSLGTNAGHLFGGVGYLQPSGNGTANCNFIFMDGSTTQVGWRANADGSVSVYRGSTTAATLIGTTATGLLPFSSNVVDYKMVEMEVVFATGATGTVKIRINDIERLNVSSVQTSNTANAYANRVGALQTTTSGSSFLLDDLYVNDDSGSAPHNTYYGEAFVVEPVVPNAVGNSTQWSRNTGANNYAAVDDTGNPGDTDYVFDSTVGNTDTYGCTNLTTSSGTVVGVELNYIARKDDVAGRQIAGVIRSGGTDYPQTTETVTGSYVKYVQRIMTDPNTATDWTISGVNALEIGVKVIT